MSKPIIYTIHALQVIKERELDPSWIARIVEHPDWRELDPRDASVERRFGIIPQRANRYLRVACIETADTIRILSAFLDRGARPK